MTSDHDPAGRAAVPDPQPELHPLLRTRWSPAAWDGAHQVTPAQVASLVEAARWAPSAGNSQPWAFILGLRGDETHRRLVKHLAGSSRRWAPDAGLLVANLSHRYVEDTDWDFSEFSSYDLGQAVAHMIFQAESVGLSARQFRAFDREALTREFDVPDHWEVTTMTAFGSPAPGLPNPRTDAAQDSFVRDRREAIDLVWPNPVFQNPVDTEPG